MYDDNGVEEKGMFSIRKELLEDLFKHFEYKDGQRMERDQ